MLRVQMSRLAWPDPAPSANVSFFNHLASAMNRKPLTLLGDLARLIHLDYSVAHKHILQLSSRAGGYVFGRGTAGATDAVRLNGRSSRRVQHYWQEGIAVHVEVRHAGTVQAVPTLQGSTYSYTAGYDSRGHRGFW